jgi:hypothetical protein
MRMVRFVATALMGLAAALPAIAQTVRCEDGKGGVLYANDGCPPGTTLKRTLPPPETPSNADARAAQQRAKQDAAQARQVDQKKNEDEQRDARQQASDAKQAAVRERECRRLKQRLAEAEAQAAKAATGKRDAAERRLGRAREDYAADCSGR